MHCDTRSKIPLLAFILTVVAITGAACSSGTEPATSPTEIGQQPGSGSMSENGMTGMAMMQPLGQTELDGMAIRLASAPPASHTVFQGDQVLEIVPTEDDSMHVMTILSDPETGERIPYSTVWLTITDVEGSVVFDERMWPMLSRAMGSHYGINVPLPVAGTYEASVQVGPPQAARHREYSDQWLNPITFATSVEWEG